METGQPIPFATIKVIGKNLGVISNDDGGFRVPLEFQTEGEGLEISCIGYEKKDISFSDLAMNRVNTIMLKTGVFELLETTVTAKRKRPLTPKKIIQRAIKKIPGNYPAEAFSYVGYYRDYQEKNDEYLNLNEAILKVFDSGFEKNDFLNTQSQIYDYSKNLDFKRDSVANIPYDYVTRNKVINNAELFSFDGNEFYILRIHDAIRNYKTKTFSYVDVFEKDIVKNHSLSREKDVSLDDEKMFVISLKGSNSTAITDGYTKRKVIGNIQAEGEIYISQSSYAIHKMVYRVFDFTGSKRSERVTKKSNNQLLYEIAVEYKEHDGKMYPNYLSLHNTFKLRKTRFYVEDVIFDLVKKCFIIKTNNSPIFLVENGKPNVILLNENRKTAVKKIENTHDGILVYPDDTEMDEVLNSFDLNTSTDETVTADSFRFEYSNIVDQYGNVLNKFVYEDYKQYREFFAQEIIIDSVIVPEDGLLMKKNSPIFKDQPIVRPDNFDEYWMNTPLKSGQ
ncbi:carboxypeptidase-like regulatory domain-containing protein [Flagellimonas meridianipacifica]|nr:carboxypeptidase-like regulatory domain-containing protein [Allomuricauda pacifica]